MRVSLVLSVLFAMAVLGLLAGCPGDSPVSGDLGTLTFRSTSPRTLVYTPSADLAPLLSTGSVYAHFDGASPAILSDVLLIKDLGTGAWELPLDNLNAFTGVADGTYAGNYNARVYVYDPSKGEQAITPVIPVQLSLIIDHSTNPVEPPLPPW
jgi:hypothetical protein